MLVIGRGLMAAPRLLLMDEPSMGLSPLLVSEIFEIIRKINQEEGVSILLVEQNARLALSIADHGYVMENGRIVLDDTVEKLSENADVKEFYLGLVRGGAEEKLPGREALQAPQALANLVYSRGGRMFQEHQSALRIKLLENCFNERDQSGIFGGHRRAGQSVAVF